MNSIPTYGAHSQYMTKECHLQAHHKAIPDETRHASETRSMMVRGKENSIIQGPALAM